MVNGAVLSAPAPVTVAAQPALEAAGGPAAADAQSRQEETGHGRLCELLAVLVVALVFVGSVVMSFVLLHSIVFGNEYLKISDLAGGMMGGCFSWLGFIAPVTATNVAYEKRPWKLWLLDNAFWLVSLLVMGAILSIWR